MKSPDPKEKDARYMKYDVKVALPDSATDSKMTNRSEKPYHAFCEDGGNGMSSKGVAHHGTDWENRMKVGMP